jgi:predicted SnoaL-like aldol condensation-catalyzing enzyme
MVHRRFWSVASLAVALVACSEDEADDACSPENVVDDATGASRARLLGSAESASIRLAIDERALDEIFGPDARTALSAQGPASEPSEDNRALVRDFVETVLADGDPRAASSFLHTAYVQHSVVRRPLVTPRALFDAFPAKDSRITYGKLEQLAAERDLVLARSTGEVAGAPQTLYDLFRVRDGRIVEHWGVARSAVRL